MIESLTVKCKTHEGLRQFVEFLAVSYAIENPELLYDVENRTYEVFSQRERLWVLGSDGQIGHTQKPYFSVKVKSFQDKTFRISICDGRVQISEREATELRNKFRHAHTLLEP